MLEKYIIENIRSGMFKKARRDYPRYFINDALEVRESSIHGLGVFTHKRIEAHELIEAAPIILFHKDVSEILQDMLGTRTALMDYPFAWRGSIDALSLGYGGIYNHATDNPNATWKCNYENESLDFYSRCIIEPGDEICTRYIPKHMCDNLWFSDPASNQVPMTGD